MECLSRNLPPRETDFWYVCAGVGSARIEVVRVSGARPRHVRVRVVSRFSALQKTCKNIEMAANASVFVRGDVMKGE